jgi:hypothetical protein
MASFLAGSLWDDTGLGYVVSRLGCAVLGCAGLGSGYLRCSPISPFASHCLVGNGAGMIGHQPSKGVKLVPRWTEWKVSCPRPDPNLRVLATGGHGWDVDAV